MTGNAYFQLKLKYQASVVVVVVSALLNLAATYVALKVGFGLAGALVAYILEFIILGIGSLAMVRRYLSFTWSANWAVWREFAVAAMPLGLSIVLTLLYFRSDTFLLGILHLSSQLGMDNTHAVAYYGLPYSMFEVFLTVPAFLMNATYPLMLKAFQRGLADLRDLMRKTLLLSLMIAGAMVLIIWILAPLAIHWQTSFNADFERSILVLRLLGLGLPAFFVTNVLVFILITLGHKRWLPGVYALAGVVNIALNLWLLPTYGIVAAALTTVGTEVLILVLLIALSWSAFGQATQNEVATDV
jgi:O-antigen/teichoic acid export membrane protein